jgi:hypothetical protein
MPKPTVKENVTIPNTILARLTGFDCLTVTVSSDAVAADANGRKIVKAGTFLGSAVAGKKVMADGAKAKPDNSAAAEGILYNDADVTRGDLEAAMLYKGTVALKRLPEAPAAGVNLPGVTFVQD